MRSCYDILGVPPGVGDQELRAAYIRLMKRHHPDASGESAAASEINRAFSTLRDPALRAAHDHDLAWARRKMREARLQRARGTVLRPPPPPPRGRGRRAAMPALILTVAGAAGLWWTRPDLAERLLDRPVPAPAFATAFEGAAPPPARPHVPTGHVGAAIVDFDIIAVSGGGAEAVSYSRRCFGELVEMPSMRLFDHCIAFDLLARLWLQSGDDRRGLFFGDRAVALRHEAAARLVSMGESEGRQRIAEVERVATSVVARQIGVGR